MSEVDLRSDTITRPTAGMRRAIAEAVVGDDVFDDDPTINQLQQRLAELLGKEAALLVPSGTMSNQIAVRVHCRPGDEVLCEAECHIYRYEQGGAAQLSGVSLRPIQGDFGLLHLNQLAGTVHPNNVHLTRTRLLALENTHNRGGGRVLPLENVTSLCRWAQDQGLATHLDGARLFNAVVASGVEASRWAEPFDTVSICFSKGLGAPVGSVLVGSQKLIDDARRCRKVLGGGMRQAGILAAAMMYALDHHVERLAEDHRHAQQLAETIRQLDGLTLQPPEVETNIVIFRIDEGLGTAAAMAARLQEQGVWVVPFGPQLIRLVTHLDVRPEDIARACEVLQAVVEDCRQGVPNTAAEKAEYAG